MRLWTYLIALGAWSAALVAGQMTTASAAPPLPHLEKSGKTVQMIVDGAPYLMLAGELHNSSASSAAYMDRIWTKLAGLNLNTVIGTVSWELVEPVEGKFDFSSVDAQIRAAHEHSFRLVLIWFGTWKNASASYVPMWVKADPQRFPMARTKSGTGSFMGMRMASLSALGEDTITADAKAFRALMRHIREVDFRHTVIMMQVENETGLLGDSRDRSTPAEAAWAAAVPRELLDYLVQHKSALLPEVSKIWGAHNFRSSGTWAEVFGTDPAADEIFMAWHVGRAVGRIAEAGKMELPIPMYANAWLGPQPGANLPGQYPSGGPVAGMLDIWRAAAPKLDLFAPDIYVADFQGVCDLFVRSGNPLFIPEARTNIANLFWAIGRHSTLGYSPFGIEDMADFQPLASAYATLTGLAPLLLKGQNEGRVIAVIEGNASSVQQFEQATGLSLRFGGVRSLFNSGQKAKEEQADLPPAPAGDGQSPLRPERDKRGYAVAILTAPGEFIIAGSNIVVVNGRSQLGTVDEGTFDKGQWIPGRRLNGDETFSDNFFALAGEKPEVRKVVTYPNP